VDKRLALVVSSRAAGCDYVCADEGSNVRILLEDSFSQNLRHNAVRKCELLNGGPIVISQNLEVVDAYPLLCVVVEVIVKPIQTAIKIPPTKKKTPCRKSIPARFNV
jgi:hypothetical protein